MSWSVVAKDDETWSIIAKQDETWSVVAKQDETWIEIPSSCQTSFATWDSATAVNVALTNGDLTATNTVDSGPATPVQGAKVSSGMTSGKYYFEITMVTFLDSDPTFGVCVTAATYGDLYLTGTGGVTAYRTGRIYTDGVQAGGVLFGGFSDGDTMGVAVDLDNRKFWVKTVDGPHAETDWNGVPGADPATDTDGVTILAGTIEPFCTFGGTDGDFLGNSFTANFGASSFLGAVPSGFTSGWTV